jgi:hypothetical protein
MNWDAVGAIAELLGAFGVIATLVYLALQVRESRGATQANTRQMRGQAFVELSQVARDGLTWLRDNPREMEIIVKAQEDWESVSSVEQRLAALWNQEETAYHELAYVLWQEGAIDEESYLVREKYFLSLLIGGSGRRTWWDNYLYIIDQRFIDRINARLEVVEKQGLKPVHESQPMFKPIQTQNDT